MSNLLPPNATALEKAVEQLGEKISALAVPFVSLHRIDDCPVPFLPWLAWQHRVEYWNPDWSAGEKRSAITAAKAFNAQRGTRSSLQSLINTVVSNYQLKPWHQLNPRGVPYTFVVAVDNQIFLSIEQLAQLHTAVDATKSQRDLYSIDAKVRAQGSFYISGAAIAAEHVFLSTL